ncbi:MAG: hypothetical protein UMU75_02455 [Halomonas sp.]|nr:hypothetical protein [Halomonas sp.]
MSTLTTHSSPVTQNSLLKRLGSATFRVLVLMAESAYRGHQAQLTSRYGSTL